MRCRTLKLVSLVLLLVLFCAGTATAQGKTVTNPYTGLPEEIEELPQVDPFSGLPINDPLVTGNMPSQPSAPAASSQPVKDEGGLFAETLAKLIDGLCKGIYFLGDLLGFKKSLGELTLEAKPNPYDLPYIAPFTEAQWRKMDELYIKVGSIASGLFLIVIFSTAMKFITSSTNPQNRHEAMDSLWRWVLALVFIMGAPVAVRLVFLLNNLLVNTLAGFAGNGTDLFAPQAFENIQTGNVLVTSLVKFVFCIQWIRVHLIFYIRDWVIYVLYVATPLLVIVWMLRRESMAYSVWAGEILTNGFLQTAYCLVMVVILQFLSVGGEIGWIHQLVGVLMMPSLASLLRNTLQGLWARWAGIDEEAMAGKFMGRAAMLLGAATTATRYAGKGVSFSRLGKLEPTEPPEGPSSGGEIAAGIPEPRYQGSIGDIAGSPASVEAGHGDLSGSPASASAGDIESEYKPGMYFREPPQGVAFERTVNVGRRAFNLAHNAAQIAMAPVSHFIPFGNLVSKGVSYAAGKAAQLGAMAVSYPINVYRDGMPDIKMADFFRQPKETLGIVKQAFKAPKETFVKGYESNLPPGPMDVKTHLKPIVALGAEWLNPNWTPKVAPKLLGKEYRNISSSRS